MLKAANQIAAILRERVASGTLRPGERLPATFQVGDADGLTAARRVLVDQALDEGAGIGIHLARSRADLPLWRDPQQALARDMGVLGLPVTVVDWGPWAEVGIRQTSRCSSPRERW